MTINIMAKMMVMMSGVLALASLAPAQSGTTNPVPSASLTGTGTALPRLCPRPCAVAGCETLAVELNGPWKFDPAPPAGFPAVVKDARFTNEATILVPGEWAMQGFEVVNGKAAGYRRSFLVPKEWAGQRIKLRCDAVFSDATVWINGREAGKHLGGFTPFELDVTALVKSGGENDIQLAVISESLADGVAAATGYACHQLGGITRGIRLFVLPQVHLAEMRIGTRFDKGYRDAALELDLAVEGEAMVSVLLAAPDGQEVGLTPNRFAPGHMSIPVPQPLKWDPEHPNLYTLTVRLERDGKVLETVRQRVGFRQVEVRGNQLFVNDRPVKLRGCNRHEVHPLAGRTVPAGLHRRDVELFRAGNVNLLRTSHYPPDEALLDAADELGMFIECEAPICWFTGVKGDNARLELVCRQTAEMVVAYRNHPSVLYWSLANESKWGPDFVASSELVRWLDPTRPQTFNDQDGKFRQYTEIDNSHYSGHGGVAYAKSVKYPYYHGEDVHLNTYNRVELATDPALRDQWGRYLRELWDDIYATTGDLGLSIWSGVDDTFFLKEDQTVGYGSWGPLDGWRREKPEYWNMKKAYSPVRVGNLAVSGNTVSLEVENRQLFSNLNEMRIEWNLGGRSGNVTADVAPGCKGVLPIHLPATPQPGETFALTFRDPRGFVADQFNKVIPGMKPAPTVRLAASRADWKINHQTGQLESVNGLAITGPHLMVLPLNGAGETQMKGKTKVWQPYTPYLDWVCQPVTVTVRENGASAEGCCDGGEGSYKINFLPDGMIEIAYAFKLFKTINPRQIGLVLTLPLECEIFSWERQGYWDVYPEDHIARLKGSVRASEGFESTSVGPRTPPSHPWRLDKLPGGNNDFCSTKHNVIRATVLDAEGRGLVIDGQGRQHVRCWRTKEGIQVLIADFSNGGAERLLHLARKDDRPLKPGDKISGTIRIGIVGHR